jgi:hypothetical protein
MEFIREALRDWLLLAHLAAVFAVGGVLWIALRALEATGLLDDEVSRDAD